MEVQKSFETVSPAQLVTVYRQCIAAACQLVKSARAVGGSISGVYFNSRAGDFDGLLDPAVDIEVLAAAHTGTEEWQQLDSYFGQDEELFLHLLNISGSFMIRLGINPVYYDRALNQEYPYPYEDGGEDYAAVIAALLDDEGGWTAIRHFADAAIDNVKVNYPRIYDDLYYNVTLGDEHSRLMLPEHLKQLPSSTQNYIWHHTNIAKRTEKEVVLYKTQQYAEPGTYTYATARVLARRVITRNLEQHDFANGKQFHEALFTIEAQQERVSVQIPEEVTIGEVADVINPREPMERIVTLFDQEGHEIEFISSDPTNHEQVLFHVDGREPIRGRILSDK